MKERPILFSAPMVRALLDGRKTQTRRIVKPQPGQGEYIDDEAHNIDSEFVYAGNCGCYYERKCLCPYGVPGDRLWVRESHYQPKAFTSRSVEYLDRNCKTITAGGCVMYGRECNTEYLLKIARQFKQPEDEVLNNRGKLKSSIHMPRWASRINLEITDVRVQRLKDISDVDAIAEGISQVGEWKEPRADSTACWSSYGQPEPYFNSPIDSYHSLWDSINGANSWIENPWVWTLTFKRI